MECKLCHYTVARPTAKDLHDGTCSVCRNVDRIRVRGVDFSSQDYYVMLAEQGGVCAICGRTNKRVRQDGEPYMLAIDHCHDTLRVRGLLCTPCNRSIGQLGDTIEKVEAAVAYLRRC